MWERRKRRFWLIPVILMFFGSCLYLFYVSGESSLTKDNRITTPLDSYIRDEVIFEDAKTEDLIRDYDFDMEGEDVLVFLHMQKTGGTTFGKHLVKNLDMKLPCDCTHTPTRWRKRCLCQNSKKQVWIFSRFSTGWLCGLHADWTELQECVNMMLDEKETIERKRRYLYITMLRDPVQRYLSEWRHVQRGATWMTSNLKCNGRSATLEEVPFCFTDEDWGGVSLEDFMACPYNLANNRQTRMLANLSLINCYNTSAMPADTRNAVMLQSAKQNLRDMAFFGLTEFQADTQYLFERTFHLKFLEDFVQHEEGHASSLNISSEEYNQILDTNRLDIELYLYAKQLFLQRLHKMQSGDNTLTSENSNSVYTVNDKYTSQARYTRHNSSALLIEFSDYEDNTDDESNEYEDINSNRVFRKTRHQ